MLNDKGLPTFGGLQNWRSEADGQLMYYVFDILWLNDKDVTGLPLTQRRKLLQAKVPKGSPIIRLSEAIDAKGKNFFEVARKMGLEGIMAKRKDSPYAVNERTNDWLKIKSNKRQEMVIGGYTMNDDTSKPFSSLLVGVYNKGKLIYTGKVGTGFSIATQKKMMQQFKPLITKKVPFFELPDINKPSRFRPNPPHATAVFLKPTLVCEVSYAELTSDGVMRHPSFEGMRIDKKASAVTLEKEAPVKKATKAKR
jgi:bifunctional non-homologous end joining protein LigD